MRDARHIPACHQLCDPIKTDGIVRIYRTPTTIHWEFGHYFLHGTDNIGEVHVCMKEDKEVFTDHEVVWDHLVLAKTDKDVLPCWQHFDGLWNTGKPPLAGSGQRLIQHYFSPPRRNACRFRDVFERPPVTTSLIVLTNNVARNGRSCRT